MSQALSTVAVEEFDSEVKHAYQGQKTLRECITARLGVVGDKYDFRLMGKGLATARTGSSADVVPMGIDHSYNTATILDYEAPEYTDLFGKKEVLIDEVQELATTTKGAIGRRRDQIAIDALQAAPLGDLLNRVISGGAAIAGDATKPMSLDTLIILSELMDDMEIPEGERFIAMTPKGFSGLLGETKVTSSDYASVKALVQGQIHEFMGFKFRKIGTMRKEGGLKLVSTGIQEAYAWDRRAVGEAISMDIETSVEWSVDKQSWLSMGKLKAGACIADPDGVIRFQYKIA